MKYNTACEIGHKSMFEPLVFNNLLFKLLLIIIKNNVHKGIK